VLLPGKAACHAFGFPQRIENLLRNLTHPASLIPIPIHGKIIGSKGTPLKSTITCSVLALLIASAAFALPLADMPERVGGYVLDDQGQPIEGASVTFIDQVSQDEYQGTTDPTGWYGNVGFSGVPDAPAGQALGKNYPNPFEGTTSIEPGLMALPSRSRCRI